MPRTRTTVPAWLLAFVIGAAGFAIGIYGLVTPHPCGLTIWHGSSFVLAVVSLVITTRPSSRSRSFDYSGWPGGAARPCSVTAR